MEEVFAGKQTPKLRAALDQLIGEARGHLETALALLAERAARGAAGVSAAGAGGAAISSGCRARTTIRSRLTSLEAADAVDAVAGVEVAAVRRIENASHMTVARDDRSNLFMANSDPPPRN